MTAADYAAGTRTATWRTAGMALRGAAGVPVRLLTWSKTGVRAKFPDGHVERLHHDDVHTK